MTAVALIAGSHRASASNTDGLSAAPSRMPSAPAAGSVTAVSILPGTGSADVVVSVSGTGDVQDFMLSNPHRVVVDIAGARLGLSAAYYDKITRAGITNVRLAQYRPDVVRLVLDLDRPHEYTVTRGDREIRISVTGDAKFAAWRVGNAPAVAVSGSLSKPAEPTSPVAPKADASVAPKAEAAVAPRAEAAAPKAEAPAAPQVESPIAPPVESPVAPRALPEAPAPMTGRIAAPQQRSQQPRITVTWQDANIRDVLAGFASFSQRTIVVGKDVTGTVTAEIKDQPWDLAMQAILQAQGLAANEDSTGIITVDSYSNILQKQASEPLTTQLVAINYANAGSLIGTVSTLLSKDCPRGTAEVATPAPGSGGAAAQAQGGCITRGSVTADTATNTLIVTEVASRMPDVLRYVKDLDVRTPQVALKAKVISVNRTQVEQLGLSYDIGNSGTFFNTLLPRLTATGASPQNVEAQVQLGGDALAGVANATRKFKQGSALNLIFSSALGKYSLTSFLDALRENDLSDIQAEPSIVTLDNKQARILVGQETPIRVIDAGSLGQVGTPARANVQFKESGIILTVTPHITSNRQIRMSVQAEQSSLNNVGGDLGFFFDKRNATTNLLVGDGETAVIGGLTQTQVTRNKSGIPFLVDLPLLGRMFGQTETREVKNDLLILITPHIIDEGEAVRPPSGGDR